MAQLKASTRQMSTKLNKALDSIGVNNEMIQIRRNSYLQIECNDTAIRRCSFPYFEKPFYLGSQIEGTTTIGLDSDTDYVFCIGTLHASVVHNAAEHCGELEMIRSSNPGYCYLRDTFEQEWLKPHHKYGGHAKPFVKNSFQVYTDWFGETPEMEGPAIVFQDANGHFINCLWAFPCNSWPEYVRKSFLSSQSTRTWPSKDLADQVLQSLCFVVPKGSDIGEDSDIEWRISFSLGERLLTFDFNVVQIRCYILMKYIKSTFLDNIDGCKGLISSYICKTVLFHVISETQNSVWIEDELLANMNHCLRKLRKFIEKQYCPHFIMPKNNLFAGKLDSANRLLLSSELDRIIFSNGRALVGVKIDTFGDLLQNEHVVTRNIEPEIITHLNLQIINHITASWLKANNAWFALGDDSAICFKIQIYLLNILCRNSYITDKRMVDAVKMVMSRLSAMLGSCLASIDFRINRSLSHEAFQWLLLGVQCSDAASSHLKLASVLFSDRDIECTEIVLNDVSKKLFSKEIDTFCICKRMGIHSQSSHSLQAFLNKHNVVNILRESIGFCVKFLPCEIMCCPKEMQFEMFRTTFCDQTKLPKGYSSYTEWVYCAVVPPEPFLYFLQYKLYKQQCMEVKSGNNLFKLVNLAIGPKLSGLHNETIWNLVAQCMEQEGLATVALHAYTLSLILEPNYNAARILICCYLLKQFQLSS